MAAVCIHPIVLGCYSGLWCSPPALAVVWSHFATDHLAKWEWK